LKKVLIVGAGGYAKEILWVLDDLNRCRLEFECVGFVDPQDPGKKGKVLSGRPILGGWADISPTPELHFACGIGAPDAREKECSAAQQLGLKPISLIHPSAVIATDAEIGEGSVLAPTSVVAPTSRLGRHCALNVGAIVGHDAVLGDYCVLSPGAIVLGNARLEEKVFLGANSTVYLGRRMGKGALLAANSFLMTNLGSGKSALGTPATQFSIKTGAGICTNQEKKGRD